MSDTTEEVGILVHISTNTEFPTEHLARAEACRATQQVLVSRGMGIFFIQDGTPEMVSQMKSFGISVEEVKE